MPTFNEQEGMTVEELYEWLQNAVQSGMFGSSTSTSPSKADSFLWSNGGSSVGSGSGGSSNSSKRKKKRKKAAVNMHLKQLEKSTCDPES